MCMSACPLCLFVCLSACLISILIPTEKAGIWRAFVCWSLEYVWFVYVAIGTETVLWDLDVILGIRRLRRSFNGAHGSLCSLCRFHEIHSGRYNHVMNFSIRYNHVMHFSIRYNHVMNFSSRYNHVMNFSIRYNHVMNFSIRYYYATSSQRRSRCRKNTTWSIISRIDR